MKEYADLLALTITMPAAEFDAMHEQREMLELQLRVLRRKRAAMLAEIERRRLPLYYHELRIAVEAYNAILDAIRDADEILCSSER